MESSQEVKNISWTDQAAVRTIRALAERFSIDTFVETGTFRGINARLMSKYFHEVVTVEKNERYFDEASKKLKNIKNVTCVLGDSPSFLRSYRFKPSIVYLDAHFYDPDRVQKFVVLDELRALINTKNIIIILHDFHNNLGHITYDSQPLDLQLIYKDLMKVNPNFKLYTNELSTCDIVKPNKQAIKDAGLVYDSDTIDNLNYAWSEPRLTYRGILYAIPYQLTKEQQEELGIHQWNFIWQENEL